MNVKTIRRENLRILAKSVGGITRLSELLDKPQSQISHLIGKNPIKNIGDKIAEEIELAFNKPFGWLDRPHDFSETADKLALSTHRGKEGGVLCQQIPLISWQEAKNWPQIGRSYKPESYDQLVPTTAKVSVLSFALLMYGDSMQSPTGISFPEGTIAVIDPEQATYPDAFILAVVSPGQGATLKQLIYQNNKQYLKPLNPRYPIVEFRPNTLIIGVVRQLIANFKLVPVFNSETV